MEKNLLKGKVALITGGGSGICMGITKTLMEHNANCMITSRNMEKLNAAASELTASVPGSVCHAVKVKLFISFSSLTCAIQSLWHKLSKKRSNASAVWTFSSAALLETFSRQLKSLVQMRSLQL
jgi:NAD(P)-dependent dehydrogenase (short-subunit alcohol dehydrogenase family)